MRADVDLLCSTPGRRIDGTQTADYQQTHNNQEQTETIGLSAALIVRIPLSFQIGVDITRRWGPFRVLIRPDCGK